MNYGQLQARFRSEATGKRSDCWSENNDSWRWCRISHSTRGLSRWKRCFCSHRLWFTKVGFFFTAPALFQTLSEYRKPPGGSGWEINDGLWVYCNEGTHSSVWFCGLADVFSIVYKPVKCFLTADLGIASHLLRPSETALVFVLLVRLFNDRFVISS